MTGNVELQIFLNSPLQAMHQRLGATMIERDGWTVPAAYGDVQGEYARGTRGCAGLIDLSPRGRFLVSGTERSSFSMV